MAETLVRTGKLVTVFGGSGFVGRYVSKALAEHGWRVRVAVRNPGSAFVQQPSGKVGQITAVQANLRYPDSIARAVRDADAVVNLVGLLAEGGPQTFSAIHTEGTRTIVEAVKAAGITRYVQMSAIGADPASPAAYGRHQGGGGGDRARWPARRRDRAPVGRVRAGGQVLQPLRGDGAADARAAADRRRSRPASARLRR